jgi:hypothetical protein
LILATSDHAGCAAKRGADAAAQCPYQNRVKIAGGAGACAIPFAQSADLREITFMASETFKASHWTRGNFLFPTVIEITDTAVIRRKRSWFRRDEMSISISKVASVHIRTGVFFADVLIESTGGTDPMKSHGHRKADAVRIRDLIQAAQGNLSAQPQDRSG